LKAHSERILSHRFVSNTAVVSIMALIVRSKPVAGLRSASAQRPVLRVPAAVQRRAAKSVVVRASSESSSTDGSIDTDKLMKDLQTKWDALENKPQFLLYVGGGVLGLWLTTTVIGAINHIPLLPKAFELVGLGYSTWFIYRYLLFKSSREELIKDVEALKQKITGSE